MNPALPLPTKSPPRLLSLHDQWPTLTPRMQAEFAAARLGGVDSSPSYRLTFYTDLMRLLPPHWTSLYDGWARLTPSFTRCTNAVYPSHLTPSEKMVSLPDEWFVFFNWNWSGLGDHHPILFEYFRADTGRPGRLVMLLNDTKREWRMVPEFGGPADRLKQTWSDGAEGHVAPKQLKPSFPYKRGSGLRLTPRPVTVF